MQSLNRNAPQKCGSFCAGSSLLVGSRQPSSSGLETNPYELCAARDPAIDPFSRCSVGAIVKKCRSLRHVNGTSRQWVLHNSIGGQPPSGYFKHWLWGRLSLDPQKWRKHGGLFNVCHFLCEEIGGPLKTESFTTKGSIIFPPKVEKRRPP